MHSCDNPTCCNPRHLKVCTKAENNKYKADKGRSKSYPQDQGPRCRLTMEQAREIRRLRKEENIPARKLAEIYEIHILSIKTIISGKTYRE